MLDSVAPPSLSWRKRVVLPAVDLGILGATTALYVWAHPIYMSVLSALMIWPNPTAFFDFEYLLTNATCWRRGVDVYVNNPCDAFDRPMGYSPLWLLIDFLALDYR